MHSGMPRSRSRQRRRPEGAAGEPIEFLAGREPRARFGGPTRPSCPRPAGRRTDGASLEVSYPGLTLGSFAGELRFTVYRGTNLIRMDAVAKTSEKWVAYKYDAGLGGFSTALTPRVTWRDTGGHPQQYVQRDQPLDGAAQGGEPCPRRGGEDRIAGGLRRRTPISSLARSIPTLATSGTQRRRGPLCVRHPPGRA